MKKIIKYNLSDQVKGVLYEYIYQNYLDNNLKLPSEKELSEIMNISRTTIRSVLNDYEQKGIILRLHGRGTFINPEAMKIKLNLMPGVEFSELIRNSGKEANVKLLSSEIKLPTKFIAKALKIDGSNEVYEIKKIYYADNIPAIVSIDYFPVSILDSPLNEVDFSSLNNGKSVFNMIVEKSGNFIFRDKIKIESISENNSRKYTDNKQVFNNDSLLLFTGINFNEENDPIVFDYELYDTNLIQFDLMRLKDLRFY